MGRLGVLLPLLLATGCAGSGNGMLVWQRNYAHSIPDPDTRAQALGSVALSAAALGDAAMARSVLGDLKGDPSYDEYAGRCAVELHRIGQTAEARRIAKRITDPERRQAAFDRLDKPTGRSDAAPAGPPPNDAQQPVPPAPPASANDPATPNASGPAQK